VTTPKDALQLCPNDHPPFAEICAGHAAALGQLGYRVRTVFFASRAASPPGAGFDFDYAPASRLSGTGRVDLLVSHRYRAYRAGIDLARGSSSPRHVVVAHEFGMFRRLSRRLRRRLRTPRGTQFAGVSDPVAEDLRASGIPSPVVLPNPVDAGAIREGLRSRSAARKSLGIPETVFAVGVVGRLHPKKDPLRALRVFERFAREDPDARLAFVGNGPLEKELVHAAGPNVVLAGFRAEVRALLAAFDIVLSCSTEREAFGLALLEALAAGVPVVAADRPGPRYVLGPCGTYFDTDDELLRALRDLRAETAARGADLAGEDPAAAVVARFSVDALAARYQAILAG